MQEWNNIYMRPFAEMVSYGQLMMLSVTSELTKAQDTEVERERGREGVKRKRKHHALSPLRVYSQEAFGRSNLIILITSFASSAFNTIAPKRGRTQGWKLLRSEPYELRVRHRDGKFLQHEGQCSTKSMQHKHL